MSKDHILVKYCSRISELSDFLSGIHPDDIISITQTHGFTVVYKSNSRIHWEYVKYLYSKGEGKNVR